MNTGDARCLTRVVDVVVSALRRFVHDDAKEAEVLLKRTAPPPRFSRTPRRAGVVRDAGVRVAIPRRRRRSAARSEAAAAVEELDQS